MSSSDESLRRVLRQLSPDFQQLTVKEVGEMKWSLKKRIMLALFSTAAALSAQFEDLDLLCESRRKEMTNEKRAVANNTISADERKESEMLHRTKFLRIIITGLQRMRWPPSLEAFSDPLEDLMNDRETFVGAFQYLYKVTVAPSQGVDAYVKRHSQENEQQQSPSPSSPHGSSPSRGSSEGRTTSGSSSAKANRKHQFTKPSHSRHGLVGDSSSSDDDVYRGSAPSLVQTSRDTSMELGVDVSRLDLASVHSSGSTAAQSSHRSHAGMSTNRSIASGRAGNAASVPYQQLPQGDANLRAMVRVLQQQNESLSAQLHGIHTIQAQKVDIEKRTETIILDILCAVGEVAGSFKGSSKSGIDNAKGIINSVIGNPFISGDSSFVTDEEHAEFQQEVQRETKARISQNAANKSGNLGVNKGRGSSSTDRGSVGMSNNNSSTSKRVTSSLIWQQVHQKLQALHGQWCVSRDESRKMSTKYLEEKWRIKKAASGSGALSARGRGTDAPDMRRAMGAVAPLWVDDNSSSDIYSGENSSIIGGGSDIPSAHQLQRDLQDFADAITAFSHTQGSADDASWDPAPNSSTASSIQQTTHVLKRKARELALHLTAHGAIPSFSGFDELQAKSHSTATESLMQEVELLVSTHGLHKRDPAGWKSILAASEGARNELLTLHSFVRSLDKQQLLQNAAANELAPLLEQFMRNAQKILRSSFDPLKPYMDGISNIMTCLQNTESSSIVDKQGNRVKPLDMLSRGYLGDNMSELVNSLRLYKDDMNSMNNGLKDLHKVLHKSALSELNSLENAKRKVLANLAKNVHVSASLGDDAAHQDSSQISKSRPRPEAQAHKQSIAKSGAFGMSGMSTPRSPDAPNWAEKTYQNVQRDSGGKQSSSQRSGRPASPVTATFSSQRSLSERPPFEV
jgi:hypothetical protein